eukprot:CFRG6098T1
MTAKGKMKREGYPNEKTPLVQVNVESPDMNDEDSDYQSTYFVRGRSSVSSLHSNYSESSLRFRDTSPHDPIMYSALSDDDLAASPTSSRRGSNVSSSSRKPFEPVVSTLTTSPNLASESLQAHNIYSRYKYYQKLAPGRREEGTDVLRVPDHIVPSYLFLLHGDKWKEDQAAGRRLTQGSVVTVFSIWNTLMGSSILTMPWAIQQSGYGLSTFLVVGVGAFCLYTAILVCKIGAKHNYVQNEIDWSDIVMMHLGKWGHAANTCFSICTLAGACLVYWVLMSNFLFKTIALFISHKHVIPYLGPDPPEELDFGGGLGQHGETWWWNLKTAPIFLIFLLLPAINMKEMTIFTKFNSLGVVSIIYIVMFALQNMSTGSSLHEPDGTPMPFYSDHFPAMTGVLFLSFFVHNMVLAILRNNEHQDKNVRDISIAFGCTALTYLVVGMAFFVAYQGYHKDIPSNILDSFGSNNYWALVCRVFLLFQIITVYPLICFVIRIQVFQVMYGADYPGPTPVLVLNSILVGCCVLCAIFYANVGSILKWTGAVSGTICVFVIPIGVWLVLQKRNDQLTPSSLIGHAIIVLLALINLGAQFFV